MSISRIEDDLDRAPRSQGATREPGLRRRPTAKAALARWGRIALAGLTPAAWVLGAPIDIRAVAPLPESRRPTPRYPTPR